MKKITKQFLFCALALSAVTFVSCDDNDDATGYSTLEVTQGVVGTVNLVAPLAATQTVFEPVDADSEITYNFTITLNEPQSVDIHVNVAQIAGSATEGDDFKIITNESTNKYMIIPAYATSVTGSVKVLSDVLVEGVEDFTLQIGDINTSNAVVAISTISFVVNNTLGTDLDLTFNFDKPFSIGGSNYTLCEIGYDMDYYVLDADGTDMGIYDAATGACTEHLTLGASELEDGTYYIYYDIYDDGGLSGVPHTAFDIPTTTNYFRTDGIAPGVFAQEAAFVPSSVDGSGFDYVMTIEVANHVFTLKNSVPAVIASGRTANTFKAGIEHARKNRKR